ncbi:cation-transporting P-type ATPase [Lacticaseibacillus camelliae]|uniref:cation-transporting P-type ATPase n=1 Tax=Lacticaseibacillus camelliae TaxID=381742 RepID=UPI0006D29E8C
MDSPDGQRSMTHSEVSALQQELKVPDLEAGLSSQEAAKRLAENGPNALESHTTRSGSSSFASSTA